MLNKLSSDYIILLSNSQALRLQEPLLILILVLN